MYFLDCENISMDQANARWCDTFTATGNLAGKYGFLVNGPEAIIQKGHPSPPPAPFLSQHLDNDFCHAVNLYNYIL